MFEKPVEQKFQLRKRNEASQKFNLVSSENTQITNNRLH